MKKTKLAGKKPAKPATRAQWLQALQPWVEKTSLWLKPGLLALAFACAWFGQEQLFDRHLGAGLWLWTFALLFAGLAFMGRPDRLASGWDRSPRWEMWGLGLVLLAALAVRIWRVVQLPNGFFFDEAMNALLGLQILQDPNYLPIFGPGDAPAPTLFFYLNALALKLFGVSAFSARLVPVVAGTLTVAVFYFLARRMVSRPVAMAAALLFAFMRWHLNFSRIDFIGILTPLFGAAAAYFLLRGLETRNRWHMALSGLAVSMGLYSYYASNLVPFVLGPYMALQLAWDRKFLKEQWQGLLAFLAVSVLVFAPLGAFALANKNQFLARNGQVLIFNHVPPDQAAAAFWRNVKTTLLMFNYFGDCNGRHNIPEAPMLSPLSGLLFGLGLIWTLTQLRRKHNVLVLLWFLVALVPGFLTIEAPQGYRCIGAMVPIGLLIALGLERVWQGLDELAQGTAIHRWIWVGLAAIVAVIGLRDLTDYFDRQAKAQACWSEFSAAEAAMGNRIHALGPEYHTYISGGSFNYPTIRFLGYPYVDAEPFQLISSVPSGYAGGKNLAYLLLPIHDSALELLRYYYPRGKERVIGSPYDFNLYTEYLVSSGEVAANRGLQGRLFAANGQEKEFATTPDGLLYAGQFDTLSAPLSAEWQGSLLVPYWGEYSFKVEGAPAQIRVDQAEVTGRSVRLAQGLHTFAISAGLASAAQPVRLLWQRGQTGTLNPVPNEWLTPRTRIHGLTGTYYPTPDWQEAPSFARRDPFISLLGQDFTLSAPFSVRWEGYLEIPKPGRYVLGTLSNEFSWVWIDGREVVINDTVDSYAEGAVTLAAGRHAIRVDYQKRSGAYPRLVLYWTKPGSAKEKIPFTSLSPR